MAIEAPAPPARRYVPQTIDFGNFDEVEPIYKELLDRVIGSAADLEQWLLDYSEFGAAFCEYGSRLSINYSCHTDVEEYEKAYLSFIQNIAPKTKPYDFALQKKYLECGFADDLPNEKYKVMTREWQTDVDIFREENIPLQTEAATTTKEYDKLCGEMLIDFDGQEQTLQKMARYYEKTDRDIRRQAWENVEARRHQDADAMNDIFDRLIELRDKIATNAGFKNYVDYTFAAKHRFDYTPEDCHAFADAIEATCMPLIRKLNDARREALGVEKLRPWDMSVDPQGREPLSPFDADNVEELVSRCHDIFAKLSPSLASDYAQLKFGRNLDLDSRKGKRPGGYQACLTEVKQPFIFMNAAGLHRDVETMLHEAGHAFHYMWANKEPIFFLQHAPIEFCEVASMAMELFADPHMDSFYSEGDAARAVYKHLEGIIRTFPWTATIDQFQHWVYSNPNHTQAQRTDAWLEILGRFSDERIDWSGFENYRQTMWQRQIHLYHHPFYYVEYGIAQLGALQLWMQSRDSVETALENYRKGLNLGGTRPLPELFAASNIKLEFNEQTMRPLIDAVEEEMKRIA